MKKHSLDIVGLPCRSRLVRSIVRGIFKLVHKLHSVADTKGRALWPKNQQIQAM